MKEKIILLCLDVFTVTAILCFIIKLVLWLRLKRASKVGFVRTFFIFFSIHDIHNASTKSSKKFRKFNNPLNAAFWVAMLGLAIVYVFNTNDSNGFLPTKKEKMENQKK